ncbi:MAG: aldehyde dehydrogenase [Alphaproteobacteria bacterium]|jgi:hypothetical protein|nr:aldehyde dehydrogenase [Alphaproteobacteria bacterium]|tara:strand:+ start:209 stop:508 length:300 start_codon:yes stop_codon:yes gene_type:complete
MTNLAGFRAGAVVIAMLATPALAADRDELAEGSGDEQVAIYCVPCHSLAIVTQQRLSRRVWDEVLEWMVAEQGMPALAADERRIVLDYLATQYSPDRPR